MKNKKIIIIGAKGMLGGDLLEVFNSDNDYQAIGWDVEEIDITDQQQIENKIREAQPDVIINAAAYNAVDKCEEEDCEFELAKKINGEGPKFLAQVAKDINATFVHYVSDYVFDGVKGEYVEADETNPISNYGISKELGEKNVEKYGEKFYLIRTSKLFGKPAQSNGAKKSFFETMVGLAEKNKELKVVDDEKSCFTYTPDLARATKELIESGYGYGTYHLINEGAVTWYEGLRDLFEMMEIENVKLIPVGSDEFPRPAKRPKASVLVNTKFPKLRNYKEAIEDWKKIFK
jgi:dTDP-4-dehydrorhamnose reductase